MFVCSKWGATAKVRAMNPLLARKQQFLAVNEQDKVQYTVLHGKGSFSM